MIKNDIWNKYIKKEILAITSYSKIIKEKFVNQEIMLQ